MKIQLDQMWIGNPVGRVMDLTIGQATELFRRKRAHLYEEPKEEKSIIEKVITSVIPPASKKQQARR